MARPRWKGGARAEGKGELFLQLVTQSPFPRPLQSFEALNQRAVSVVIDPVQSVKGKVVIDAFRLISPQTMILRHNPLHPRILHPSLASLLVCRPPASWAT